MQTQGYLEIAVFVVLGLTFPLITILLGHILRPHVPDPAKATTYECGEVPYGDARAKFNVRYFVFALVFLVFDVETVFLYPWATRFRELGLFGFVEMMIFIGLLAIGLVYAWRKGVLEWV